MTRSIRVHQHDKHVGSAKYLKQYTVLDKLTDGAGAIKAIDTSISGRGRCAVTAAQNDIYTLYFVCDGTETKLEITTYKMTDKGKWNLWVNDVLDSSSYDDYAAAGAQVNRSITLTKTIKLGINKIELKVASKNVSSSNYEVRITGASLQ